MANWLHCSPASVFDSYRLLICCKRIDCRCETDEWSLKLSLSGSLARAEIEAIVSSLKQHLEAIRQHEVKRLRARLGQLNPAQENAIESLTQGIVDEILEAPINVLKSVSYDNDSTTVIETVCRIFSLANPREYFQWQPANVPGLDV